ncbi:MAG: hypothetical protein D6805_01980 [Planctomycetota bacterium]|nr:MAG: hypothetical protein D6805_01980 [Planctomycetota bacterium]
MKRGITFPVVVASFLAGVLYGYHQFQQSKNSKNRSQQDPTLSKNNLSPSSSTSPANPKASKPDAVVILPSHLSPSPSQNPPSNSHPPKSSFSSSAAHPPHSASSHSNPIRSTPTTSVQEKASSSSERRLPSLAALQKQFVQTKAHFLAAEYNRCIASLKRAMQALSQLGSIQNGVISFPNSEQKALYLKLHFLLKRSLLYHEILSSMRQDLSGNPPLARWLIQLKSGQKALVLDFQQEGKKFRGIYLAPLKGSQIPSWKAFELIWIENGQLHSSKKLSEAEFLQHLQQTKVIFPISPEDFMEFYRRISFCVQNKILVFLTSILNLLAKYDSFYHFLGLLTKPRYARALWRYPDTPLRKVYIFSKGPYQGLPIYTNKPLFLSKYKHLTTPPPSLSQASPSQPTRSPPPLKNFPTGKLWKEAQKYYSKGVKILENYQKIQTSLSNAAKRKILEKAIHYFEQCKRIYIQLRSKYPDLQREIRKINNKIYICHKKMPF